MERKVSELEKIPLQDWPKANYPKSFEQLDDDDKRGEPLLFFAQILKATRNNQKLANDCWEAMHKHLDDTYYTVTPLMVHRQLNDHEKRQVLDNRQRLYSNGRLILRAYLERRIDPQDFPTISLYYMQRENIKWDLEY